MTILWANNASTTISGSINTTDTQVQVAAGTGAIFPNPGAGDYFVCTFYDQLTKTRNEICHCVQRSGDTFTIVRAQEGTAAQNWTAADLLANLVTAGTLQAFTQGGGGDLVFAGIDTGTPNHVIAITTPVPASYQPGQIYSIKIKNENTGATDLSFNGVAAVAAKRTDGSDLIGGNIYPAQEMLFVYNGVNFNAMIPPIPQKPPQNVFYVRTDGNDNNSGFANTPDQAFRTVSGGMYAVKQRYISSTIITMVVADGIYTDGIHEEDSYIAAWDIVGNISSPGNVVIDATPIVASGYVNPNTTGVARGCVCSATGNIVIDGFVFQSYYENVATSAGGQLDVFNCNFTAPLSGVNAPISALGDGHLGIFGNCSYTGAIAAVAIFNAATAGTLVLGYADVTGSDVLVFNITGAPIITVATVVAQGNGVITLSGAGGQPGSAVSFTGSIPNCKTYYVDTSGGIIFGDPSNANIIPGTQPPTIILPGWTLTV
jgi:hypothetical protein